MDPNALSEDQQLLNNFLQVPKNHRKRRVQAGQEVFSQFNQEHLDKLKTLFESFSETLDSSGNFSDVITRARQEAQTEDLELVQEAVSKVVVENDTTRDRLQIPSLISRRPRTVLRHRESKFGPEASAETERKVQEGTWPAREGLAQQAQVGSPQEKLSWWTEDPLMNEHHEHYHLVFDSTVTVNKDRQGELFIYMHKQMVARYDAERRALGLPKVKALDNFSEPLDGYTPHKELRGGQAPGSLFTARSANQSIRPQRARELEGFRNAVRKAITDGRYRTRRGGTADLTADALGGIIEPSNPAVDPADRNTYGWLHNAGHMAIVDLSAGGAGVIGSSRTASRDPAFWRWHKFVDQLYNEWTNRHNPLNFNDAPKVQVNGVFFEDRPQLDKRDSSAQKDKYNAYGQRTYGGPKFTERNIPTATNELQTMIDKRTFSWPEDSRRPETISYVRPKEWVYFIRLSNTTNQIAPVTVRIFIVPKENADDRTSWIEMDKFSYRVAANAKAVVARPMDDSAVIRKRALKTGRDMDASLAIPSRQRASTYCDCGWPYNLLLPRGSSQGMQYVLLAMVTDGNLDQEISEQDDCSSVSFCGVRDRNRFPDRRPMGYPFNAPFKREGNRESYTATFAKVPSVFYRDFTIREVSSFSK